jgi:hypothetical protein
MPQGGQRSRSRRCQLFQYIFQSHAACLLGGLARSTNGAGGSSGPGSNRRQGANAKLHGLLSALPAIMVALASLTYGYLASLCACGGSGGGVRTLPRLGPSSRRRLRRTSMQCSEPPSVYDLATALFWTDSWLPEGPIALLAPSLFQAIRRSRRNRSVKDALTDRSWVHDISGAPTASVLCDYVLVWERTEHVVLQPTVPDRFVWAWTADRTYTASSAYRSFFIGARHLWRAAAPPKVIFFFWVAAHGRLWTAERRRRHGLQQDATCALCDQDDETSDHLLCSCVITRERWHKLLLMVGLQHFAPGQEANLMDWWQQSRVLLSGGLRRAFDSAVLLVT